MIKLLFLLQMQITFLRPLTSSLLPSDRQPIIMFSEFYRSLLSLEDAGVRFTISVDEIMSRRSAAFYIDLDYILNSSNESRNYIWNLDNAGMI